jgi:hypothetical protein
MTAVFSITARPAGDTVADTDVTTIAWFVNPTIDAGVILFVPSGADDPTDRSSGDSALDRNAGPPIPGSIPAGLGPSGHDPLLTLPVLFGLLALAGRLALRHRARSSSGWPAIRVS